MMPPQAAMMAAAMYHQIPHAAMMTGNHYAHHHGHHHNQQPHPQLHNNQHTTNHQFPTAQPVSFIVLSIYLGTM